MPSMQKYYVSQKAGNSTQAAHHRQPTADSTPHDAAANDEAHVAVYYALDEQFS